MPIDPRLVSSQPGKVLKDSQLKFFKDTNIDYADSFKKSSTEPPFTINRFDETDLRRKLTSKKPRLNPRLSFITEENSQAFELFTGVGRFDNNKKDLYNFDQGRANTLQNFTQYPDYKPMWAELYFSSPTVGKRARNTMPSVNDPDPQNIIKNRAEGRAEGEVEGDKSIAQLLAEKKNKKKDEKRDEKRDEGNKV